GHLCAPGLRGRHGLDLDRRIRGEESGEFGHEVIGVDDRIAGEDEGQGSDGDAPPILLRRRRFVAVRSERSDPDSGGFGVADSSGLSFKRALIPRRPGCGRRRWTVTGTCTIYSSYAPLT